MLEMIVVVKIPACDRDYSSTCGAITKWDAKSKELYVNDTKIDGEHLSPPRIGSSVYIGHCHSSSETCDHCYDRELHGEIIEIVSKKEI